MNQYEAVKAIFSRFLTMWPGLQPSIPFVFDNDVAPESAYIARCGIKSLDSEHWTLGARGSVLERRPGYIDVRITGPIDKGRKTVDLAVVSVRTIFERQRFGVVPGDDGIITHATNLSELTRDRDAPQLWIAQTLTPFEFYETI